MPKYTPNLNIQLADPATDGNQTFNIETMINDPVKKLDEALGLVPVSGDVRVATTGNIVLSGAQTIDGIALAAGNRVLVKNQTAGKENGIYTVASGAWTRTADANSTAKLAAGISVYVEEGAANGKTQWQMTNTGAVTLDTTAITFEKTGGAASATDAVIGSRTVSDATAPTGDSGTVTTLFGWLASMIKAITGGATWRTLPGMSIAAIKTVLDAATNLGTASTLMKRDANGRAQVAAPSAAADIARKDTVDGAIMTYMGGQYSANLNAATTVGIYYFGPATLNKPIDGYGAVEVFVSSGLTHNNTDNWIWQRAVVVESGRPFNRMVWIRKKVNNSAWEEWSTLSSETVADITYYVRTDGNDNNAGTANTAAGAFKTIGKAVSMIPQIVNHPVNINVAAGTYAEDIIIHGFVGRGYILITGTSAIVSSIGVYDNPLKIAIHTFTFSKSEGPAIVYNNATGSVSGCTITTSATAQRGIYVDEGAELIVSSSAISNRYYAIFSGNNSVVTSRDNTGSGNTHGLYAYAGEIHINGSQPAGSNDPGVDMGGLIIPQVGVINPWGDNTAGNRPYVFAFTNSTNFSIPSYQNTKVPLNQKAIDFTRNYDQTLYRFTAPASGIYLVSGYVHFLNPTVGNMYTTKVYHNGGESVILGVLGVGVAINTTVGGTTEMSLAAGDYIELFVLCSADSVVYADARYTSLKITRIA